MTLGERVRTVRKTAGKTQKEFSAELGITGNYVYLIESDKEKPSARTLNDICRIYSVNKEWLENGEGEAYTEAVEDEAVAQFLGEALSGSPDTEVKKRFISAIARMDESFWKQVARFGEVMLEEQKKQNNDDE